MTASYLGRGRGRSIRAGIAERQGRMPMSRAKVAVAKAHGCTQAIAAAALELLHTGEWHHVGKYAKSCEYYDTTDDRLAGVIAHIAACGGPRRWSERRRRLKDERRSLWRARVKIQNRARPGRILRMLNERATEHH